MKKIIFRFLIFILLLIFVFIIYLSTIGIKTNGFNDQIVDKNDHLRETLIIKLQDLLITRENNGKGLVHLLSQDPYQSSDLMCADDWHANNEGRALHTKNLYRSINDRLQLKK